MRRAISTSPSRVSRATEDICRMYMRTGSTFPAVSPSTATTGARSRTSSSPRASSAGSGASSSSASSVPSMATTPSRRSAASSPAGCADRFAAWFVLISGSLLRSFVHAHVPSRRSPTSGACLVRQLLPLLPGGAGRRFVAARLGGADLLPHAALHVALAPPADRGHAVRELLLPTLPLLRIVTEEPGRDA